jgi:MFS family permease
MVFGWAAGLLSVHFLGKAPEFPVQAEANPLGTNPGSLKTIRDLWKFKSFRAVTGFVALHGFSMAAFPGFLVVYLRDELRLSAGTILLLGSTTTLGSMAAARFLGNLTDRFGSRPMMRLAGIGQVLVISFFAALALGHGSAHVALLAAVYLLMGVFTTANGLPQTRILLASCPRDRITHALAASQVVIAISSGASPLIWGIVLESLEGGGPDALSPFTLFFISTLILYLVTQVMLGRIREADALPATDLFVRFFWRWPFRVLSGFWIQRREEVAERVRRYME